MRQTLDIPESDLVRRVQQGDMGAFRTIVRSHQPRLLAVAMRRVRSEEDARELVQDAFMRAFNAIHTFAAEASLGTWLHRILVNVVTDFLRKSRLVTVEIDETLAAPEETSTREIEARLQAAIESLSSGHRAVFQLCDLDGESYAAIAAKLAISQGTVMSRLFYARQNLRAQLEAVA